MGTAMNPHKLPVKEFDDKWEEFENDDDQARSIPDIEDTVDAHGLLLKQQPDDDKLIYNELQLQLVDKMQKAKVIQRSLGSNSVTVGTYDDSPSLN